MKGVFGGTLTLQSTLMYDDIQPYINSTLKRLVKSPKYYLLNNGIISVLTGILDTKILETTGLIGHRLKNWFLSELHTWLARNSMPSRINFWRTTSGAEVDFVVTLKPFVFPFEVTSGQRTERKKVRNLLTFLSEESSAKWGVYIYGGEPKLDFEKKIMFIPHWSVA